MSTVQEALRDESPCPKKHKTLPHSPNHPQRILPPLSELPLSLHGIALHVSALVTTAAQTLSKEHADAARESTFEFLGSEDPDVVARYTPVYAAAQLLYAQSCYHEAIALTQTDSQDKNSAVVALDECLRAVDLTILRTNIGEWSAVAKPLLREAESLRSSISALCSDDHYNASNGATDTHTCTTGMDGTVKSSSIIPSYFLKDDENASEVPRIDIGQVSIETFISDYMSSSPSPSPVIICGAISSWPALNKWSNIEYLKSKAAGRLVPVETYDKKDATQTYLTDTWEQQVMSFGDFVDNYIVSAGGPESEEEERGYLAQYQLFEQIPSLMNDIEVPSLCSAVTEEDSSAPLNSESTPPASPLVSAWFGPKGTVSPLHNDPYHNLLAQVVGSKYLRLYQASDTELVYPREGPMCNNSYINLDTIIDNPNESKKFPRFREAKFQHCILKPGELLYIPRHYWHYVRSLEMSFSSSFWWGAKMALQRVVAKDSKGKGGKDKDVKYVACY